jgi:hypothetical protein
MKRAMVVMAILAGACSVTTGAPDSTPSSVDSPPAVAVVVPSTTSTPQTSAAITNSTKAATSTTTASPDPALVVTISGGEVISVFSQTVALGSHVVIVVSSDMADEVHLHTYDIKGDLSAGTELVLEFDADIAGVFEMELETAHLQILELIVTP